MVLVDINDAKEEEIVFPVLRRSKRSGGLFVFSRMQKAMCIESDGVGDKVGDVSDAMHVANNYRHWEKVNKAITG